MEVKSTNQKERLKPSIRTYVNAVNYLCDYYEYRKSIDTRFSYEIWAYEIGFKSKSSLRQICHGQRNISIQFVELFSHKENLNEKETEYFILLAKIQNNENISLKKIYLDKIAEQTDISSKKVEIKNSIQFLSDPLLSKIQLLISFEDFVSTEAHLIQTLNIEKSKLSAALKTLEKMNLIEPYFTENKKDQMWKSKVHYFSVTDDIHQEAINLFHQQTFKEAEQALKMNTLAKKFKSLFFALSEEDYKDVEETLNLLSNKLKVKYGSRTIKRKKLYKINMQVYPVTDTCD